MNDSLQFWQDLKSGRFVSMVKESAKGRRLSNSQEVYNVLKPMLAEQDDVEKVYIIFLDAQNKILAIEKMFSGSITASSIYPREIIKRIILSKLGLLQRALMWLFTTISSSAMVITVWRIPVG
jgi:DNA repair protein RadC